MQKLLTAFVCVILLFTSCKKETLLETNKDLNPTNLKSKQTTNGADFQEVTTGKVNSNSSLSERLQCTTSISSNFNGTSIKAGNFIWFSSVMKITGVGTTPVTINFFSQTITSNRFTLNVPDAVITINPTNSTATTSYNGTSWVSSFPKSFSGNVFLSGAAFQVPSGGIPGGTNPVTWSGSVSISDDNVKVSWQWGAAVYTNFSSNLALLGVKPCDDNSISIYQNSNHAGTPQDYKKFVTGGARGGGGSNFTGSYSSTGKFNCNSVPELTCPDVVANLNTTTICGSGNVIGSVTEIIPGDIKLPNTNIISKLTSSNTYNQNGDLYTTTWTVDGQTFTGNTATIPFGENNTCSPITKTVSVNVICNSTQTSIYQSTFNVIINPKVTSTVVTDDVLCTGVIQFSCSSVTNVSWSLGTMSGTGDMIPLFSSLTTLNYSYSAFGCSFTGTADVQCEPGVKNNTTNSKN